MRFSSEVQKALGNYHLAFAPSAHFLYLSGRNCGTSYLGDKLPSDELLTKNQAL